MKPPGSSATILETLTQCIARALSDDIEKLAQLRRQGVFSKAEFAAAKAKLLTPAGPRGLRRQFSAAVGLYALGGEASGTHVISTQRCDAAAVDFFTHKASTLGGAVLLPARALPPSCPQPPALER